MSEQYKTAAAAYQRALDRDPSHPFAWLNLANAHYEMNQYADAGGCFKMAYETATENNPEYLYYSAVAYLMADDYHQSFDLLEQLNAKHYEDALMALTIHPNTNQNNGNESIQMRLLRQPPQCLDIHWAIQYMSTY